MNDVPAYSNRARINPYRTAAGLLLRRLRWDFKPESWRSRARLRAEYDKYAGQKAVILCNGPSLLKADLRLLEGVFCYGLNKINLLFDKNEFRPSCIVAVNPFVIEQNEAFFNSTNIRLFLDAIGTKFVRARDNVVFLHSSGTPGFAQDCSLSVFQGHTVTYVAMQLAFHMGFHDVALIGCDHDFAVKGPANATVVADKEDKSHFDPRYFSAGMKWQLPDLAQSEAAYEMARAEFHAAGRRLVNCTEGGKLEILERMTLRDFLNK